MQPSIDLAAKHPARIVYAEGENEDVLLAMQAVVDEGVAKPILIGRPQVIDTKIEKMGLRLVPGRDFEVFNSEEADVHKKYWQFYHHHVGRSGVSVEAARTAVHSNTTILAALMVAMGEADGMVCGKVGRFDTHLKDIRPIIRSTKPGGRLSSVCVLLMDDGPLFLTDPFVNVNPSVDEVVDIAKDAISFVQQSFDIEPVVALLSHSNFGSYEDDSAIKMKTAAHRLRMQMPEVQIDGEMHALTALNPELRATVFEGSNIKGRANVLVMPNMDTASIALGLLRSFTNGRLIGPFLCGLEKPAHILIPSVSGRGILNLTALASADIFQHKNNL
nr:phosphate acyltransferase [Pseudohongiella sp.]